MPVFVYLYVFLYINMITLLRQKVVDVILMTFGWIACACETWNVFSVIWIVDGNYMIPITG